jgi:hypothetical protein
MRFDIFMVKAIKSSRGISAPLVGDLVAEEEEEEDAALFFAVLLVVGDVVGDDKDGAWGGGDMKFLAASALAASICWYELLKRRPIQT